VAKRPKTGPLTKREEAAWRAMVRAFIVIPRIIEADLVASSNLNLADYTVMANLSEQPNRSMRMSELAAQAAMSPSGLTRVVERLSRQGIVERVRADEDGRGQIARLTDNGMQRLTEAYPHHVESVRRRVLDHFDGVELAALADALNAVGDPDQPESTGR
jgi:DNA-binding MarR family transcriptional regulator